MVEDPRLVTLRSLLLWKVSSSLFTYPCLLDVKDHLLLRYPPLHAAPGTLYWCLPSHHHALVTFLTPPPSGLRVRAAAGHVVLHGLADPAAPMEAPFSFRVTAAPSLNWLQLSNTAPLNHDMLLPPSAAGLHARCRVWALCKALAIIFVSCRPRT